VRIRTQTLRPLAKNSVEITRRHCLAPAKPRSQAAEYTRAVFCVPDAVIFRLFTGSGIGDAK